MAATYGYTDGDTTYEVKDEHEVEYMSGDDEDEEDEEVLRSVRGTGLFMKMAALLEQKLRQEPESEEDHSEGQDMEGMAYGHFEAANATEDSFKYVANTLLHSNTFVAEEAAHVRPSGPRLPPMPPPRTLPPLPPPRPASGHSLGARETAQERRNKRHSTAGTFGILAARPRKPARPPPRPPPRTSGAKALAQTARERALPPVPAVAPAVTLPPEVPGKRPQMMPRWDYDLGAYTAILDSLGSLAPGSRPASLPEVPEQMLTTPMPPLPPAVGGVVLSALPAYRPVSRVRVPVGRAPAPPPAKPRASSLRARTRTRSARRTGGGGGAGTSGMERIKSGVTQEISLLGSARSLYDGAGGDVAVGVDCADLQWDEDGGKPAIKAASLERLLQCATGRQQNLPLQMQILLTYTAFTDADTLLEMLLARYCTREGDERQIVPIRVQSFHMIKLWISERPFDFVEAPALLERLTHFREVTLAEMDLRRTGLVLKRHIEAHVGGMSTADRTFQAIRGAGATEGYRWTEVNERVIAEQITQMEHQMFVRIRPRELFGKAWSRDDKEEAAPNVLKVINFFNRVSSWVVTSVVTETSLKKRASLVCKFISVGMQFRKLRNLSGVMAVVAALRTVEVKRLKKTWARVPDRALQAMEVLLELVSMTKNHAAMRRVISDTEHDFCLPYLGMFLTDLTFTEDGNPDTADGLINFRKWRQIANIIGIIERHQKMKFVRPSDIAFCSFLRSTEILDEDTTYDLSLKLEPRKKKKK